MVQLTRLYHWIGRAPDIQLSKMVVTIAGVTEQALKSTAHISAEDRQPNIQSKIPITRHTGRHWVSNLSHLCCSQLTHDYRVDVLLICRAMNVKNNLISGNASRTISARESQAEDARTGLVEVLEIVRQDRVVR